MDIFLIIVGAVFVLAGIAGSVLPVLPGLPLSWLGLLLLKFTNIAGENISWQIIVWVAVAVTAISILDNLLPVWGTKRRGGDKFVVTGASVGLVFGFLFGPLGIVIGPFVGAFLGALIEGNRIGKSFHQAMGAFIGFLTGIVLKLACGGIIVWFFIRAII